MKFLLVSLALLVACSTNDEPSTSQTEACDSEFQAGWGQGYGVEIQVLHPTNPDNCAQTADQRWWCCVL